MKTFFVSQHPDGSLPANIEQSLGSIVDSGEFDSIRVAVAYATVAGIRGLLRLFPAGSLAKSEWLLGLDDALTQPGAIDLLLKLQGATVRLAELGPDKHRFHSKILLLRSTAQRSAFLMIGSANLTKAAFRTNAETVSFNSSSSLGDVTSLAKLWKHIWATGHVPTRHELSDYKKRYSRANQRRPRPKAGDASEEREILEDDDAVLDPQLAETCWIECGYITAMGRELELKAEQALFFGLSPTGEDAAQFKFWFSDGGSANLKLKYQENSMWRLQMNNDVPEVRTGLRPRLADGSLGRSTKVAVIRHRKAPGEFTLRFVELASAEFRNLKKESATLGTLGRTRAKKEDGARWYGWC